MGRVLRERVQGLINTMFHARVDPKGKYYSYLVIILLLCNLRLSGLVLERWDWGSDFVSVLDN